MLTELRMGVQCEVWTTALVERSSVGSLGLDVDEKSKRSNQFTCSYRWFTINRHVLLGEPLKVPRLGIVHTRVILLAAKDPLYVIGQHVFLPVVVQGGLLLERRLDLLHLVQEFEELPQVFDVAPVRILEGAELRPALLDVLVAGVLPLALERREAVDLL